MRTGTGKKFMVILMALIMVMTMIPNTISAANEGDADRANGRQKDGIDAHAVSLSWKPEKPGVADPEKVKVSLEASYDVEMSGMDSVDMRIRLEEEEAGLLMQFRDHDSELDETIAVTPFEGNDITIGTGEGGALYLDFTLNREAPALKTSLDFGKIEENGVKPGRYEVAVEADDIEAKAYYDGSSDGELLTEGDVAADLESFTVVIPDGKDMANLSGTEQTLEKDKAAGTPAARNDSSRQRVEIGDRQEAQSVDVFWIDNKNEMNIRPGQDEMAPVLRFSIEGDGNFTELTEENMDLLGLAQMPDVTVEEKGIGRWTVKVPELPSQITCYDTYGDTTVYENIQWEIVPKSAEGYQLEAVTQEDIDSGDSHYDNLEDPGWYYVLAEDIVFDLVFRKGEKDIDAGIAMDVIEDNFFFNIEYREDSVQQIDPKDEGMSEKFGINVRIDSENKTGVCSMEDVAKYNLDGTRITYSMEDKDEDEDRINVPGFEEGDHYSIIYDNTAVPGFTSQTGQLYSGGTMYLTLAGTRYYEAVKLWLDDGKDATVADRPTGEFQLWRYREGSGYTTAAPVRNSDGDIMSVKLGGSRNDDIDENFDSQKIQFGDLPKYDTEGYRYYYVLREYLDTTNESGQEAQNYAQVFGGVNGYHDTVEGVEITGEDPDNEPRREAGNTFLYNGGILLNRIDENTRVSVSKVWNAAAFQAAFEGVKIEMTLYSRNEDGEPWTSTGTTRTMENFSAEISVDDISASVPKYDEFGQELQYVWRETGVYQGDEKIDLKAGEKDFLEASFTLRQDGRDVEYTSQSEIDQETGNTVVTNSIANTVRYTVDKKWYDENGQETEPPEGASAKFAIYRVINGEAVTDDKKVAEFTMDGEVDEEARTVNRKLGISVQEKSPWNAVVKPLTEFDEKGNQYEYVLLEMSGDKAYIPEYEVSKDKDGNYHAVVINAPGSGQRIMVRKNWNDNSDIAHREPVTITAYEKGSDESLNSITLGDVKEDGSAGVWYDWLGIPEDVDIDDVYILETKVGDTSVPVDKEEYDSWTGEAPALDTGDNTDYSTIQYQAAHHKYEVSYSVETVDGLKFYTAENRRLGNVDLTVTKEWTDGDGSLREEIEDELERIREEDGADVRLAVELRFHDGSQYNVNYGDYKIVDEGDRGYVSIGRKESDVPIYDSEGEPVSSRQAVDFTDEQQICFWGLPKYDANSDIVRYDVREVWLENGKEISKSDLRERYGELYDLIADYSTRYADGGYTIVENHGTPDKQAIGVENYLSGTKDIRWKKSWHDLNNYENSLRPDIYLDIYSLSHVENGAPEEKAEIYQKDYRWTFDESLSGGENPSQQSQYSKEHYWLAQIEDVPKYDALGYEIKYYAIEKTIIDKGAFDYTDVRYLSPDKDITDPGVSTADYIGSEYEIEEDGRDFVIDVGDMESAGGSGDGSKEKEHHYALIEEGTFNNHLNKSLEVTAEKLWSSLPEGYDMRDLPTAKFTLYRQLAGDPDGDLDDEEKIAEITIKGSDWADILRNGSYRFQFLYEGVNEYTLEKGEMEITPKDENAARLQKYDEEGNLWRYTVVETSMETDIGAGGDEENTGGSSQTGGNITVPDFSKVFSQAGSSSGVAIENTYGNEENLGSLSVKKLLYLPMSQEDGQWIPEAYPAATFKLTRTYTKNDGTVSSPETVATKTWNSKDVKSEYDETAGSLLSRIAAFFTGNPVTVDGDQVDENGNFGPLEHVITFEALELYAPNGSEYVYTIQEVKSSLNGYDTWAVEGDVAVENVKENMKGEPDAGDPSTGDLTPALDGEEGAAAESQIAATFINRQDVERETVTVSGQKNWKDYGDVFKTRPEDITLTLYRQADSQPGQGNAMEKTRVSEDLYTVEWDKEGDVWTYTMTGNAKSGQDAGELEKYAPNGMPWKYSVQETLNGTDDITGEIYDMSPAGGGTSAAGASKDDDEIVLGDLTNSMMTSTSFSKTWVDSGGNVIDEDLLGVELSVDFTLQVAEVTRGDDGQEQISDWSDAKEYFEKNLGWLDDSGRSAYDKVFGEEGQYKFTRTKTGSIDDDSVWGEDNRGSFSDLPGYIKKGSPSAGMTGLTYRVVEREISYETEGQTVIQTVKVKDEGDSSYKLDFSQASVEGEEGTFNGIFAPAYPDGDGWSAGGAYEAGDSDFANMLKTTEIAAKKVWQGDENNAYGTREETGRGGYDWEVTFAVQRSLDGVDWTDVAVTGESGGDAVAVPLTVTIYGNDSQSQSDEVTISGLPQISLTGETYRYRVRELDTDDTVIDGEEKDRYNTSYEVEYSSSDDVVIVSNILETTRIYANKIWNDGIKEENRENLTFELKYLDEDGETWRSFEPEAEVALDGISKLAEAAPGSLPDGDLPYGEYAPWKASWSNVPLVMPGSCLDENGHTIYTVMEEDSGRYLIETTAGHEEYDGDKYYALDISNNEKTWFTVEKSWLGVEPDEKQEVTAAIYRAAVTEAELEEGKLKGDEKAEAVTDGSGAEMTVALNQENRWKATIEDLPKYDEDGRTYVYFARESAIGGEKPSEEELYISYENGRNQEWGDCFTRVINVGRTDIEGSKIWKDNGNACDTRPDDVKLELLRWTEGGEESIVTADKMEAEGIGFRWTDRSGDEWSYEYTGLPVTDSEGHEYTYKVREAENIETGDGDTYQADSDGSADNGYTIINTLTDTIDIPVDKIWKDSDDKRGTRPDSIDLVLYANGRECRTATVERPESGKLSDGSRWEYTFEQLPEYDEEGVRIEYTVGEKGVPDGYDVHTDGMTVENIAKGDLMVTKTVKGSAGDKEKEFTFTVKLDDETITGLYGEMEFQQGTAQFTLKDGESLKADGLPGGTGYSVREEEADSDGYVTSSENGQGRIPAGDMAVVEYINSKDIPPVDADDTDTKTGDDSNPIAAAAVMAASLAAIAALLAGIRRKSEKQKEKTR